MPKLRHRLAAKTASSVITRWSLAICCVLVWLVASGQSAIAEGGTISQPAPAAVDSGQFTRVGIVPFKDEGNLRGGAEDLLAIWQAQLTEEFPEVEFVLADPAELDLPAGPLLLNEAIELGGHYQVQALLTGVFGGVEITGGTWPNAGASFPSAKGLMSWRLVECNGGLLVADGAVSPRKPKAYSPRVKDTAELARRVLQDLARAAVAELHDTGALAGTTRPQEDTAGE